MGESDTWIGRSSLARRRRILIAVVVGAVLLSGAGLGVASMIKSPAQVAAAADAPDASVISDRVERRVLTSSVVVRGRVTADQSVKVTGGLAAAEGKPVVTKVNVRTGDTFSAGKVLLEVSGRPVFAMKGALPVYRDLKPGATGKDVKQLQEGLARAGHASGADPAGTYGPGTKEAVRDFYADLGYDPLPADPADEEKLAAAQDAVDAAERQVTTAGNALAGTKGQGKKEAELQLAYAKEDLVKAESRFAAAQAVAGPMVPADEMVFLKSFPARVDGVEAAVGAQVGNELMTISAGALVVRGSLAANQKDLVQPGMKVQVLSETTGITAAAEVVSVADTPEQPPAGGEDGQTGAPTVTGGYPVLVKPDKPLDTALAGQDVRLTVESASSKGPVLAVPVSAVSAGADGRTTVTVLDKGGTLRRVEVKAGMTADGFVAVEPVGGGKLADGDRVVVGEANAPATGSSP